MRALTRWAMRLYPRWWRDRYGAEFEALLEDSESGATLDVVKGALVMQAQTMSATKVLALGGLLGGVAAFFWALSATPVYRSTAVMTVAEAKSPEEMASLVNQVSREILDRKQLVRSVVQYGLYKDERERQPLEDVLVTMRRNIRIAPTGPVFGWWPKPLGFSVSFDYADAAATQKVVSEMMQAFARARPGAFRELDMSSPGKTVWSNYMPTVGGGIVAGLGLAGVGWWLSRRFAGVKQA
jgi:hypothetical protein